MIMDYRVLQMHATEDAKDYIFRPSRELILSAKTVYPPPLELYGAAYTGKASALDPEELYCIYNDDFPRREKARSLSVSDIIEYTFPSGERLYLFCDSFGFDPVDFGENYRVCKEAEYLPRSAKQTESVRLFYGNKGEQREVMVNVPLLHQGVMRAQDGLQNHIELTLGETLKVLYVSENGCRRIRSMEEIKTIRGFQNSGFEEAADYLEPGDPIEESFIKYLRDSLVPEIDRLGYLQIAASEKATSEKDCQEPCFLTFIQKDGRWDYLGFCRRNEYENRIPPQNANDLFLKIINK